MLKKRYQNVLKVHTEDKSPSPPFKKNNVDPTPGTAQSHKNEKTK